MGENMKKPCRQNAKRAIYLMLEELGFTPDELAEFGREMIEIARRAKALRAKPVDAIQATRH
jgi:hypothetical protein